MSEVLDRHLGGIRLADLHVHAVLAAWRQPGRDGVSAGRIPAGGGGSWPSLGQLALILAVAAVLIAAYLIGCRIWPYGPCLRCIGHAGRNRGSNSRRWGRCRRCAGTGQRIRLGARLQHKGGDR